MCVRMGVYVKDFSSSKFLDCAQFDVRIYRIHQPQRSYYLSLSKGIFHSSCNCMHALDVIDFILQFQLLVQM